MFITCYVESEHTPRFRQIFISKIDKKRRKLWRNVESDFAKSFIAGSSWLASRLVNQTYRRSDMSAYAL